MPNKDGIVSIGFDYKKDLEKMIKDFETEMNSVSNNAQLSKGMKKQFDNILAEMREFKASMDKELANLGSGKVSQSSFKSFKQTVENKFKGIREDIDRLDLAVATLNDSIGILGKGVDLSKISNDFKNFEDYVTRTNSAVENLIHTLGEQGISLFSFDNRNISDVQSTIRKIDNELKQLDKDTGAEFELFNEKQAQDELNRLSVQLTSTLELMENAKKQMETMDTSTEGFKKVRGEFASLQLKAASLNDTIEMLYEVTESKGMYIEMDDKSLSMYEKYTDELADNLESITLYAKNAKKELSSLLDAQKSPAIKVSSEMNPNSSELATVVTIETTSSELWKKLSPIMEDLQKTLNSNPVVAPVKLVVAPTSVSSAETGNLDVSKGYSKKYQKILAQTGEDAVVDLEGVYKKTFTSVMDTATSYAKETIGKIQEVFDKNRIGVKFDISQEEIDKIQNFVLSNKDGKKVDISGQITKAKQEVEELNESIEKTAKLLDDTKSKGNVKFDGFDKFTQDVSKSIGKLEELQNILKALQNIEITLAKASGIASITELDNQWANVEKRILNATKLDGSFRKNASVNKIASEYQKYIDMGGTNSIADIDKIKDSKDTIDTIISKAKEFAKQDLSNDSIKELSIELDGIIGKFDELIATVKTATNALYKIIKQTGVSELDKQWSSITNKFKSFADESGKINLSKQKKDVEELLVMYQRYVNMGGSHTPFDLTDNLETVSKLDKAYKKLNETKPIDNSSTIKSETESFKQVEQSVDSLTKAIGDTKVQAINVEATAMEDAAEREILAINAIVDNLNMIVSKLKEIKGIKIPKIQVESVTSTSPAETNISSENIIGSQSKENTQALNDETNSVNSLISAFRKLYETNKKSYKGGESLLVGNFDGSTLSHMGADFSSIETDVIDGTIKAFKDTTNQVVSFLAHTHPGDVAAFSAGDIYNAFFDYINNQIKNYFIIAKKEISWFDTSSLDGIDHEEFLEKFKDNKERIVQDIQEETQVWSNFSKYLTNIFNGDLYGGLTKLVKDSIDNSIANLGEHKIPEDVLNSLYIGLEEKVRKYIDSINDNDFVSASTVMNTLRRDIGSGLEEYAMSKPPFANGGASTLDSTMWKNLYDELKSVFDTANQQNENIQNGIKQALIETLSSYGINADDVYKSMSFDNFSKAIVDGNLSATQSAREAIEVFKQEAQAVENIGSETQIKDVSSNISSENPTVEVSQNDEVTTSIRKKKEELASYELQLEETRYEIEKLSKAENESFGFNRSHTKNDQISSLRDSVTRNIFGKPDNGGRSGQKKWFALGDISNIDSSVLKSYQMWNEELSKAGYKLSEIRAIGKDGLEADIIPIDGKAITNAEEFRKALDNITTAPSENVELLNKQVSELESKISSLKAEIASLQSNQKSPMKDVFQGDEASKINEAAEATNNLADAENRLNIVEDKKSAQKYWQGRFKDSISDMTKTNEELVRMKSYYEDLQKETAKLDNSASLLSALDKYTDTTKYTSEFISRVNSAQSEIKNIDVASPEGLARLKEIDLIVDEIISDSKLLENKLIKQDSKIADIISKMKIFRDSNTNMSKSQRADLQALIDSAEVMAKTGNVTAEAIEHIKIGFSGIKAEVTTTGNTGLKMIDRIVQRAEDMNAKFIAQFFSWQDWLRYLREGFTIINEIDKSITELRKVSNGTASDLRHALNSATEDAKELGASISNIVSMQSDWARLGYSIPESEELARTTQLYVNVGDNMSAETASENLISTLQGFQLEAEDSERIIDMFNEVANNFAIDTQGIGEALKRSAASFNSANTSLSESIALVTTANAVVQDPDSIGTTFKTMSARIRGAETELESLGEETDEYTKTTSKLRDLIEGLTGFDIMEDEDTFKSIYDIVLGIGKEWDKLSDIEQASLGEAIAGKRNANVFYSVMQNIDELEAAYKTAEESAGSAMREQENYEKSIQYSIDSTRASLEALVNTFNNSEFFKGIIDAGGDLLDLLTLLIDKFDVLGTAITIGGGILGAKNIGRPKMFGLYKYADINMCSLGY